MRQSLQDLQTMTEKSSITYKKFYDWVTVGYLQETNIQRSRERIVQNNEVFTSLEYVLMGLDFYPKERFLDSSISFCDTCAGEGTWLVGFALKRMEYGMSHAESVKNLKAVELMMDNRNAIISRLMCKNESLKKMLETNIVCSDSLRYHYRWDNSNPYESNQDLIFNNLFEQKSQ
jgi:hypothetical protein